ncbi:MAG TPA: DUF429 domain-containing protein [Candidatus Acidoferrales bacterium]|nr:DUF429 domain-containing protein [Candidatus Acidoferrales bacterium]
MSETTFVGIDLAWTEKNRSGVAVLTGDRCGAHLIDADLKDYADVLTYVENHTQDSTVIAIDAPLIIRNETGQRPCESALSKNYGSRHASCHSSNLSRHRNSTGTRLTAQLESLGFRHAPLLTHPLSGHVMLEVYPHPALVELFRLPHTIKYKKGNVTERRRGQRELQQRLGELSSLSPPLEMTAQLYNPLQIDTNSLFGIALKSNEDRLDAIVCAYIAYYYWFWGPRRAHLFGDVDSGYIIVPSLDDAPLIKPPRAPGN